jgi:hypothetical protein
MRPKWMILLTNVSTSLSLWAAFDNVPQGNDILNKCQYLIEFMSCFRQCAPSCWNGTIQLVGDWSTSYNWWRPEESVCWDWCGLWHHLQGIYIEHAWDHDKWEGKKDLLTLVKDSCCLQLQSTDPTSTDSSISSKHLNSGSPSLFSSSKLSQLLTTAVDTCIAGVLTAYQQHMYRCSVCREGTVETQLPAKHLFCVGDSIIESIVFFSVAKFHTGWPKEIQCTGYKGVFGKKEPMSPYIDHDIWPYMAKYGNIGSFFMIFLFYFSVWPLAKFGSFLLWMITSSPISWSWKTKL